VVPTQPSFAAFRGQVDRTVYEPGFGLWLRMSGALGRFWRAAITLPDRGDDATSADVPPECFRFPPF
jgi:hypothetical protein